MRPPDARVIPASAVPEAEIRPLFPTSRLLKQAVIEVDETIAQAKLEAQQLLEEARREADQIRAVAREEAATARQSAADQYAARAEPLLKALEEAVNAHHAHFAAATKRQVLEIARRVISAELVTNPTHLLHVLADVVEEARSHQHLLILVHPDDEPILSAQLPKLRPLLATAREVSIVPDKSLARHTIRIRTEMGTYEDGIRQRLAIIEAGILSSEARDGQR